MTADGYDVNRPGRAKALAAFQKTLAVEDIPLPVPRGENRRKGLPFLDYEEHPDLVPTRDELLRHARKYGWEGVGEVAAKHGIDLKSEVPAKTKKPKPARQRRTSAELREQVLDLDRRGLIPAAIVDNLNVGDQRVKEILRETSGAV